MSDLRITDTNSANDSRGRAFGLEGNDFIYLLVALMVAFGLFLLLNLALRVPAATAGCMTVPIFLATTVWVVGFRLNRPAGYAEDWFENLIGGKGWTLTPRRESILDVSDDDNRSA